MLIESQQRVFSIHAGMKKSVVEVWDTARQVEGSGDRSPARGDPYLSTPVTVCESERPLFQLATPGACQSRDTAPPFSGQLVPRRLLRSTGGRDRRKSRRPPINSAPSHDRSCASPSVRPSVRPLLAPLIARRARRRAPAVTLQRAAARRDPGRLAGCVPGQAQPPRAPPLSGNSAGANVRLGPLGRPAPGAIR